VRKIDDISRCKEAAFALMGLNHTFGPDAMVTVPLDLISLAQIKNAAQSLLFGTQWKGSAPAISEI